MNIPRQTRPGGKSSIAIEFDVSIPSHVWLLHWLRGILQEHGEIESIDEDHYVLIIQPSAAQEVG